MGIYLPQVKFSTTLSTIFTIFTIFISWFCFLYSFSRTTNWRKIRVRKKYKSRTSNAWVPTKEAQFTNITIFSWFILSFTFSKWPTICPENEYGVLSWVWALISKHVGLTIFTIFSKSRFLYYLSRASTWRNITSRKEYRNLTGVRATVLKIFFSVYR